MVTPKEKATVANEKEVEKPQYVTKYTIKELANAAKAAFDTSKVVVLAALKCAGKDTYTMEDATKIIKTFKNKEVK